MMLKQNFKRLPLGLAVSAALLNGYVSASEEVEIIEVKGIRSSLSESMHLKKHAASIQDSIVAEDIGKFPDQNVAESLQRISGVMIDRNNGEGSKITVRGMGPQFNTVDVNGRTLATTDRGREFDFQTLPSELIAGADVIKASRANIREGSLGAYVNVTTARPLDNPGFQAAGSLNYRYNDLAEEFDPKISGIVSNTFADDTFGVLLGVSYLNLSNRIDAAETNRWNIIRESDIAAGQVVRDTSGNVVDTTNFSAWTPGRAVYSIDFEERTRKSANLTLQWTPSDNVVTTLDYLYSDLSRQANSSGIQVPLQGNGWENLVVSDNRTMIGGTRRGVPIDGLPQQRGQDSETQALGLNTVITLDRLTVSADLAYSKAESLPRANTMTFHYVNPNYDDSLDIFDPNYIDGQIKGLTANDFIHVDNSNDIISIDSSIDYANPAAVRSWWTDIRHNRLEDEIVEAKLDFNYELEGDLIESVDFGIAYLDREKSDDLFRIGNGCRNVELHQPLPNPALADDPELQSYINRNTLQPFNTCQNWDLDDSLFSTNNENFLKSESGNFPRNFTLINDIEAFKDEMARIRNEPNWTDEIHQPAQSVVNTEETLSIYAQLNLQGETQWFNWSGNVGVRYVDTETASTGHRQDIESIAVDSITADQGTIVEITYGGLEAQTLGISYDHVLPSANFSLDFSNGFYIKTAAAKVITRPAIEDTGVNSTYPERVRTSQYFTSGNNPFLEPYSANQFDISFEYYEENGNSYSLGLFYKDIDTFISQRTVRKDTGYEFPENDGSVLPFYEIRTEPNNRSGGEVRGFEAAALHYFDYLPGWMSGFGVQANYTYTDTEDKEALADDQAANEARQNVASAGSGLEGFSKNAFNVIAFYDKDSFQARLAYNWRGGYLKHRSNGALNGLPHHVDDYGQFDFSTSYDISDSMVLSAEVINLTDEGVFHYADIEERMVLVQYTGRRYQVGVTMKF